jgi:hypothetical protein
MPPSRLPTVPFGRDTPERRVDATPRLDRLPCGAGSPMTGRVGIKLAGFRF